jgi:hypothetical protein
MYCLPYLKVSETLPAFRHVKELMPIKDCIHCHSDHTKTKICSRLKNCAITYHALTTFFVRTKIMFPPQLNKRMILEKDTETYQQTAARLLKRTRRWRGM